MGTPSRSSRCSAMKCVRRQKTKSRTRVWLRLPKPPDAGSLQPVLGRCPSASGKTGLADRLYSTMPLMSSRHPQSLIRPLVLGLHPYIPGEQPKIKGLIKLNTNENPYPPSPRVLAATRTAVDARLRLYPNPTAQLLRDKLARLHGCRAENIIVGNGSDELLAMAVRTFVEPDGTPDLRCSKSLVQFFTPSYSLYPVLEEAYVDFASENAMSLALKYSHVLVARTFSKAYSLCFQRVGYCVGHAELIAALHKIRDSRSEERR